MSSARSGSLAVLAVTAMLIGRAPMRQRYVSRQKLAEPGLQEPGGNGAQGAAAADAWAAQRIIINEDQMTRARTLRRDLTGRGQKISAPAGSMLMPAESKCTRHSGLGAVKDQFHVRVSPYRCFPLRFPFRRSQECQKFENGSPLTNCQNTINVATEVNTNPGQYSELIVLR